ncbi:MAG TPA: hypothetical protein VG734_15175 [Lacunisphaera sp.]|nr:hypothetical protein [Lacunisphaera sp.]
MHGSLRSERIDISKGPPQNFVVKKKDRRKRLDLRSGGDAVIPVKREVDAEEKAFERLRGEYQDTGRHSLAVAVGRKERKIESLSTGFVRPFAVTYIIRVWDETEQGLAAKCAAVKNAINNMAGAQYYDCARPSTAKKIFFASWLGWTHSGYKYRSLYAEDTYLADMLPFSATFTGHLSEAEAIFEGSQKNLLLRITKRSDNTRFFCFRRAWACQKDRKWTRKR